ncbi:MAG: thiamine pyrophosphate-binding protein, partial [Haloarculaceae archaeon]
MSEQAPVSTPDAETTETDDEQEPATEPETDAGEGTASQPVTTGAESVIAALENAGVETLFGVQGGAIMPVYDALYDSDLTHVTMAHEQGAAHAADAYGIVSGKPGVCLATSGPGATNLVTGIADASMDSDPMIALTGQVPTNFVGNDAFQETDTVGVTQPITKESYFADASDTVGADVSEAFALADQGRQGPTLVDLPKDVTKGETDSAPTDPETPDTYNPPEDADEEIVDVAAEALAMAERPVVLAGGGVIKGEASDELRRFAKTYEIPVITTMPGIGSFPEDHELSLSWAGMHGTGYANMAITNCDCMLAIGTRFDDRLTGSVETFAPDAEIIHVDIDPAEISKNIEADYPLVGDASIVLEQLEEAMADTTTPEATSERYAEWREQCDEWKAEYPMTYDTPEDEPLKPQYVVERFSELTPDDTIVTTGVGQHQMW